MRAWEEEEGRLTLHVKKFQKIAARSAAKTVGVRVGMSGGEEGAAAALACDHGEGERGVGYGDGEL